MVLKFVSKKFTFANRRLSLRYPRKRPRLETVLKILNEETGLIEDRVFQEKKTRRRHKDFLMVHQDMLRWLSTAKLKPAGMRLLLLLCSQCEWANKVSIRRKDLMLDLGLSKPGLWQAFRSLQSERLVLIDPQEPNDLFIDPTICWKGFPEARAAASADYQRAYNVLEAS